MQPGGCFESRESKNGLNHKLVTFNVHADLTIQVQAITPRRKFMRVLRFAYDPTGIPQPLVVARSLLRSG